MFEINLLPESYRRAQRSTPFKLLGLSLLIGAVAYLGFLVSMNYVNNLPKARALVKKLEGQKRQLTEEVRETDELSKKYAAYRARIDAVRTLYKNRIIWAKLLMDMKALVAKNQGLPGCKLWLSRLSAREDGDFSIEGYSSGPQQTAASNGYIGLFADFDTYVPLQLPEKQELDAIDARMAELAKANPDPAARPDSVRQELAALEQNKRDLADIRSGRIAIQPFQKFIKKGTFRVGAQTWAPVGGGSRGNPDMPEAAWKFSTTFKLQPPGADEEN